MPQSFIAQFDGSSPYSALDGVRFCACNAPADFLVVGKSWNYDLDRFVPCKRWVCEQCRDNLKDDGAELRVRERQILTDEQEQAWDLLLPTLDC